MGVLISNMYDKRLLESGIGSFSVDEKNNFIMYIAKTKGIAISDINNDFLLQYHRDLKIKDFSTKCEDDIIKGFVSQVNSHTYPTGRDDQFNMFATYVLTKDNPNVTTIKFKAQDVGEQILHTKDEFQSVVMEGFMYVQNTLGKLDALRKQIKDCSSDSGLVNIIW